MKCLKCNPAASNTKQKTSLLSALFVAIVPKCGLCVMAYSSAITMCGGEMMYRAENNWVSYIPILLSAVVIMLIGLNKRDYRTYLALGIASVGSLLILAAHQTWLVFDYYTIGNVLLFVAIWMNGSMFAFFNYIRRLSYSDISWQK